MNELLVEYAAGSLAEPDRAGVEAHLAGCAECRAELAGWAVFASVPPVEAPGPELIRTVMLRSALGDPEPVTRRPVRFSAELALAEARLVRISVLVASALVMAVGVVLTLIDAQGHGGLVLSLLAPVVAGAGIAAVYSPRHDPAFEVVAATPTSQRLILLTRITLIFAYDLVLSLAASGVMAAAGADPAGLRAIIAAWLGPMALLSALSLVMVVWVGPEIAMAVAVELWAVRLLADGLLAKMPALLDFVHAAWSTNLATALVTVALVGIAIIAAGRGEPVRRFRATNLT